MYSEQSVQSEQEAAGKVEQQSTAETEAELRLRCGSLGDLFGKAVLDSGGRTAFVATSRRCGPPEQCGGGQSQRERSINNQQGRFRQAMFEAGCQPLRREMEVNRVRSGGGYDGRGQNGGNGLSGSGPPAQPFVPDCPENGCRMVDYIANDRVSKREAVLVRRMPPPEPLAWAIHRCHRVTQFRLA